MSGTITETVWPFFSRAWTKGRTYGLAWAEGGPSSFVTWMSGQCQSPIYAGLSGSY